MDHASLTEIVRGFPELRPHLDVLRELARPCVDLHLGSLEAGPESSRFGGRPYLPKGFAWPTHPKGEYRFLGQIDFSAIRPTPTPLPCSGLLTLFHLHDEDGEIFWQDDGYVIAHYWRETSGHGLHDLPSGHPTAVRTLSMTTGLCLPERQELVADDLFEEEVHDAILYDLPGMTGRPSQWILGYPYYTTLGYDPTPGAGWLPLLTVPSIDLFDWCWHDGDMLMVFIEAERLAAGDFSVLKCDAG